MERKEDTLELAFYLKTVLENKLMGPILDSLRASSLGDRQFDQMLKTIKNLVRTVTKDSVLFLSEYENFTVDATKLEQKQEPKEYK